MGFDDFGIIVGGYTKIFSALPFNDVEISHMKGNIESNDTKINTKWVLNFSINFFISDTCSFQNRKY